MFELFKKKKKQFRSYPFIIAEMSGNHNQSLKRALKLVEAAHQAGADAIKLQTYTADTMTINSDKDEFSIKDKNSLWNGQSLHKLYQKAYTPWEWHKEIINTANKLGLICFSSPFDESAVDFLEKLNVPAYKIASFECIDLPLIKKVASTGKPIIISTGMATITEISEAVDAARSVGCKNLALLKCTSTYPSDPKYSNIKTISHMKNLFGCEIGISDHTLGIGTSIAAVAFGAKIIEKHLTLSRKDGGVDSTFSLEPSELRDLVEESRRAYDSIGSIKYGPTKLEIRSVKRRRSLYIVEDLKKGEILTDKNLRRIRPGLGLPPKFYEICLGKKLKKNVKAGTPVSWDLF